ncbi:MAG: Bifunctional protein PutA, partial [Chlamydiae bacterium]|nr:Bifunctional protein PutA [Chlamydiota bacterium]
MPEEPTESKSMHLMRDLLASAMGAPHTLEQREQRAIELASHMLTESNRRLTKEEKKRYGELSRMMHDPVGKVFITSLTDQCFRSHDNSRIANQMLYLLNLYGIPRFFAPLKRLQLYLFKLFGEKFANILVPIAIYTLRRETSSVIIPGEKAPLLRHIKKRRAQGIRLNLNHLGEAVLGEEEALLRLKIYVEDLKQPSIDYVSIKISTVYSQINLLAWDHSLNILSERLRELYRAAIAHPTKLKDGRKSSKFVNLDMEEYRDLLLTKELFMKVLSEPEFHSLSAGIVLQAYLPDSLEILEELTEWAMERVKKGGAPIKVRIVKGANMSMEQHEASIKQWPQAPYTSKVRTDANFKRMVLFACESKHARAVHVGIASHNIFDIAFAMLLRLENRVEHEVTFEMLEGMADHMRRVVQALTGDMLLYCAVATREDFQSAIAYLIRRLDENTGAENFLAHSFGLKSGSKEWEVQSALFSASCKLIDSIERVPRRKQNRLDPPLHLDFNGPFDNEPDTDFSLPQNRKWGEELIAKWKEKKIDSIPLVIDGEEIRSQSEGDGYDPTHPMRPFYTYSLASWEEIDRALTCAKREESSFSKSSIDERCQLLAKAAVQLRENRADQLGSMIADGGKLLMEADVELSETIDFAEFYLRSMRQLSIYQDIEWSPKGTILVAPPWNFPNSIPGGGIFAALVTGNCVLFKPAPESVLAGWQLVTALWEAGIPKTVLQFINCDDEPIGSKLIQDERLNAVILTGATSTAQLFIKMRPGIDLSAETGGKNALIITAMADRDQAIKDLVQSAFGHSGQKCSAASLAIIEKELYDDPRFQRQLRDAVASLKVGSPWD